MIRVEICSNCHPFFTGKQKLIDTAGRVERFQKKYADKAASMQEVAVRGSAPSRISRSPGIRNLEAFFSRLSLLRETVACRGVQCR